MILNDKTSSGRIIGRVLLIDQDDLYVYNQRTERIEVDKNKYDSQFLYRLLNADLIRRKIIKVAQGNTQIYVNWSSISEIDYIFPLRDEQIKIGKFLNKLDSTIALHQRKLELLNQLKKGCLQDMFPEQGENVPKLRFADFDSVWGKRKLEEVVEITMGQSPNGKYYTENPNDHILVQGNADIKNGWVKPRVWTTQITKTADKGDIILSVRAPVGDVGKTQYNIVLGRGVAGIKGNKFIFQLLLKMKEYGLWTKYSTGSTFESINSKDLKEAIIVIPDEHEQVTIGRLLKQLDTTISLHQTKLEKLQSLKRAYLQKMFI